MTTPNEITIAWMAGLFDGEGTISVVNSRVLIAIHMTDLDILEKAQTIFGGTIYPMKKQKEHHKISWKWQIGRTTDALTFLEMIEPHLGVRRKARVQEARIAHSNNREAKYREIIKRARGLRADGLTHRAIADKLGTSREYITRALNK